MIAYYFVSNQWQISDLEILLDKLEKNFDKIVVLSLRDLDFYELKSPKLEIVKLQLFNFKKRNLLVNAAIFLIKIYQFKKYCSQRIIMSDQPTRVYEVIFNIIYPGLQINLPHTFFKGNDEKYQKIVSKRESKFNFFLFSCFLKLARKLIYNIEIPRVGKIHIKIWEEDLPENRNTARIDNYHFAKFVNLENQMITGPQSVLFASSGAFRYTNVQNKEKMAKAIGEVKKICDQMGYKLICVLKSGELVSELRKYTNVPIDTLVTNSSVFDVMGKYNINYFAVADHSSLILELLIARRKILVYEGGFKGTLDFSMLHSNRYLNHKDDSDLDDKTLFYDHLTPGQLSWVNSVIGTVGIETDALFREINKLRETF